MTNLVIYELWWPVDVPCWLLTPTTPGPALDDLRMRAHTLRCVLVHHSTSSVPLHSPKRNHFIVVITPVLKKMALDLSLSKLRDDNNNTTESTKDLNIETSEINTASSMDLTAMNLLCLAQLQETSAVLRNTLLYAGQFHQSLGKENKKTFSCDFEGCEKVIMNKDT